jgi:hypothetical protein
MKASEHDAAALAAVRGIVGVLEEMLEELAAIRRGLAKVEDAVAMSTPDTFAVANAIDKLTEVIQERHP